MKLKKILNEITKLHEENEESKIQLMRKQRSLDFVNKERDDLFLENNRLKDKLKELIDLQFELDRLSGYQMTKEEVETFKDLKDFIKDSVTRNHYKPVGINSLVEKLDKSKEMEFEERLQRAVDRLDKDHEIDDIEDELNQPSDYNPEMEDENHSIFGELQEKGYVNTEMPSFSHVNSIKTPSAFYLKRISGLDNPFIYTNSDLMFVGFYSNAQSCINNLKCKEKSLNQAIEFIEEINGYDGIWESLNYIKVNGFRLYYEKVIYLDSDDYYQSILDVREKLKQDIEYLEQNAS